MGLNQQMKDWQPGEPVTAADLNETNAAIQRLQDPWVDYTPQWSTALTQPALGNGTIVGEWRQVGRTVDFRIEITAGSSTTFGSGAHLFTVPIPFEDGWGIHTPVGQGVFFDASAANGGTAYTRVVCRYDTTTQRVVLRDSGGVPVNGSNPVAGAINDKFILTGRYQAAPGF